MLFDYRHGMNYQSSYFPHKITYKFFFYIKIVVYLNVIPEKIIQIIYLVQNRHPHMCVF